MNHVILILFLLVTTIIQADDVFPFTNPGDEFENIQISAQKISSENHIKPEKAFIYQPSKKNNGYYYSQYYGNYSLNTVQYPLFYYLPDIKEEKLTLSELSKVPEFDDTNDILNQKSEQAIKRNSLNKELSISTPAFLHNEVNTSGSDLSEITASSLIFSARKKQRLEVLFPGLLNNQRLFLQDRERLQKLFNDFKSSKKITAGDEIWLYKLSEEYSIIGFQANKNGAEAVLSTVSQLK